MKQVINNVIRGNRPKTRAAATLILAYLAGCATSIEAIDIRAIGCEELEISLDRDKMDPIQVPGVPGTGL